MKYRKWDPKIKAKIVLESLQNKISLAEIGNQPDKVVLAGRHQITQSQYYYWLNEFQAKSHEIFNTAKKTKKERRLVEENKELKRIIANLTIELKKNELELEGEYL